MRRYFTLSLCLFLILTLVNVARAHFGMILPDKSMVMQGDKPELEVVLSFNHPFEQKGMDLIKPKRFGVMSGKTNTDLTNTLQETKVLDKMAWKGVYAIKKPGIYTFYFEPQPYFEPAEDKFIIHITKTYVAALGGEEDWDQEVGLKAEIIPLTRPFGLYAGNVFRGMVKFNGKPVADTDVEVEYWNPGKKIHAPNEYFTTLKLKTDKNGVFAFAPPQAGWWGFSAINEEKDSLRGPDGKKKKAEYGAVLWVQFTDWPKAK
jgi:cobalt/nickel transport protein